MRVAVLPRDVAAGVITGSISRIGWAVGAASLILVIPPLIEVYVLAGQARYLPLPLALLAGQLALLCLVARRGSPGAIVFYLLAGSAAVIAFQVEVMTVIPNAATEYVFLLNRSTLALVLVGVTSTSTLTGISWLLVGLAVALGGGAVASAIQGVEYRPGVGPFMVAGMGVVAYLTFASLQRAQRAKVPNFDELEAETQRLARGEDLARRTTAVVHDTLLNDLSIVMNGPDRLDPRAHARLRQDLDTLTSAEWLTTATAVVPPDDQDAELRNEIMRLVSDFQWRGLTVQVTGAGSGVYRLEDRVAEALLSALRAALENALRHSGASAADLVLAYDDDTVTVMITDQGRGFDPAAVPDDRLGLRASIVERVEAVGGHVDIWSSPGSGASIVMRAPVAAVVRPHPPSAHRESHERDSRDRQDDRDPQDDRHGADGEADA